MNRKQEINNLRLQKLTYQQIADKFCITRQRVHQILTGYASPKNKKKKPRIVPMWKISGIYNSKGLGKFEGRDFLKELVRKRDNYTCQICGKVWNGGRRLDVHHLDPELEGKNGYSYEACKNLDRQITLCHKCHLNLDSVREKMLKINRNNAKKVIRLDTLL